MKQLLNYPAAVIALGVCYPMGLLITPNRSFIANLIGFLALCITGPALYITVYCVVLFWLFGYTTTAQLQYFWLLLAFGALASPFAALLGVYRKPWRTRVHPVQPAAPRQRVR